MTSQEWEDTPEAAHWLEQDERDAFEEYREGELARQAEVERRQELKDRLKMTFHLTQLIEMDEPPRMHQWKPDRC